MAFIRRRQGAFHGRVFRVTFDITLWFLYKEEFRENKKTSNRRHVINWTTTKQTNLWT